MHDNIGLEALEGRPHGFHIADVAAYELVPRIVGDRGQGFEISGICQLVEDKHAMRRRLDQPANHGRTDEPRSTGDEISFRGFGHWRSVHILLFTHISGEYAGPPREWKP